MKQRLIFILGVLIFLLPSSAFSWSWTPIQLSVWEPVQLFPENFNVYGVRMNLVYGINQNLTGLDIGGLNLIKSSQRGGQLGLVNLSEESWGGCAGLLNYTNHLHGFQLGLLNTAQNSSAGLQFAGLMNLADSVRGLQAHFGVLGNGAVCVNGAQLVLLAGYNLTENLNGLQLAMFGFNYTNESVRGVQFAMLYNYASHLNGLQLALVNVCENLSGIQIGLVNCIRKEKLSIMPLINFNF